VVLIENVGEVLMAELETKRLFLRTLKDDDVAIVRALRKSWFDSDEDALGWIRWTNNRAHKTNPYTFFVWLAKTNQLIGSVHFIARPDLDYEVELGYMIVEEYRGKGYATEAVNAIVEYAFKQASQEYLMALIDYENPASRRVVEKLGFDYCGIRMVEREGKMCKFEYYKLINKHLP